MRKITISLAAVTALTLMPTPALFATVDGIQAVAAQKTQDQSKDLMSLGATLNATQSDQTKRLLGGVGVPDKNIIQVDGNLINRYLNDGSDASTPVYSSALIQPQNKGYGVQVQIVTPQNIQQVSQATYQNAAITAGAKDVLVRVATVLPVTGEGALAGVYALLAQTGKELKPQDVVIADKEIVIINNINNIIENKEITNININMLIADIKIFVINQLAEGQDPSADFENFVKNYLKEQGYPDEEINALLQDEAFMNEIRELIDGFKQTDAAKDKETAEQLEKSLIEDMGRPWLEILPTLTNHPSREELAKEKPTELNLDDETLYHPAIKAMYTAMRGIIESGEGDTKRLYSHTFVYEALRPNIPPHEHQALNLIRTLAYYNMAAPLDEAEADLLRDYLMGEVERAASHIQENPVEATAIQAIANATGLAPQAYRYFGEEPQEEQWLSYRIEETDGSGVIGSYAYDTQTHDILDLNNNNQPIDPTFNFEQAYGVVVENEWIPYAEIAAVNPESQVEDEQPEELQEDSTEEEKEEQQESTESVEESKEEPKEESQEEQPQEGSDDIEAIIASMEQEEQPQEDANDPPADQEAPAEDQEDVPQEESKEEPKEEDQPQEGSDDIEAIIASMEQEADTPTEPAEHDVEPVEEAEAPADEPTQEDQEVQKEAEDQQGGLTWTSEKQAQLDDFVINQWGPSLDQSYTSYTLNHSGDFHGVEIPNEALNIAQVTDAEQAPLVWVGDSGELQPDIYNVVAVYSDFNPEMEEISEGHLYFMAIKDNETYVFIADQEQSLTPLAIKLTQNAELQQKFSELAHQ